MALPDFLRSLIPVETWIWIVFFLIPCAAAAVWQVFLCLRAKKRRRGCLH